MLEVFEPGALNYFTIFRPIPLTLICIKESNLNSSSSFQIHGFYALRIDRTRSRFGILSRDATHASGGVISFVRQSLSYSELFTSYLSLLDSYSSYVPVNISLNNSYSLAFLRSVLSLLALLRQMAEPTLFFPPFFPPPEISSFWGTSSAITPSGNQEVLSTPVGRKYSTGLSLLTSFPLMSLTHPPFYIASLAAALSFFAFPTPGRCFRTWVLINYQFFYLSLSPVFLPTSVAIPLTFRKLSGMTLPPTLTLTVLLQTNSCLFRFLLLLLSSPLWH